MKRLTLLAALLLAGLAQADDAPTPATAGLLGSRRVTIESTNVVRKAWRRDVVMVDQFGRITGDGGVVGEKASTEAIDEVASNAYQIAQSAQTAMTQSMDYLYSKTNQMAQYCIMTALHVAPETVRSNLTGYVVKTTSNGTTDHQWVWYNHVLALKPNRYVTYAYFGGSEDVKCEWVDWTTNGVSVVVDGKTWEGCHECTITRPAFAQGELCLDLPNETWGGASGIEWGDMTLTHNGVALYTGFVTNSVTGQVLYFDNGFLKPTPVTEE